MKEYIEHLAGFALLLDWQSRWHSLSDEVVVSQEGLELGAWVGQRFLLGAPRRPRYGKGVFLGVQATEAAWLSRIRFSRAALSLETDPPRLHLVSTRMPGDGGDLTDIPAFTLSLPVANAELAGIMANFHQLEARSVWVDDGQIQVASGPPLFRIPLAIHSLNVPLLSESEKQAGRTMEDVINERLATTNREQPQLAGAR